MGCNSKPARKDCGKGENREIEFAGHKTTNGGYEGPGFIANYSFTLITLIVFTCPDGDVIFTK
jgi:hypothetical protein